MTKKHWVFTVEYEGRYENGEVFDFSRKPLSFISGKGMVIEGFEEGISKMKVGEVKEIRVSPEKGYGPFREELVLTLPLSVLEGIPNPHEGMEIIATLENNQQVPVKITKITQKYVVLDFNHPLAGKTLIFKVKLLGKRSATEEEILNGQVY